MYKVPAHRKEKWGGERCADGVFNWYYRSAHPDEDKGFFPEIPCQHRILEPTLLLIPESKRRDTSSNNQNKI